MSLVLIDIHGQSVGTGKFPWTIPWRWDRLVHGLARMA